MCSALRCCLSLYFDFSPLGMIASIGVRVPLSRSSPNATVTQMFQCRLKSQQQTHRRASDAGVIDLRVAARMRTA
jgi:hypothetical protein